MFHWWGVLLKKKMLKKGSWVKASVSFFLMNKFWDAKLNLKKKSLHCTVIQISCCICSYKKKKKFYVFVGLLPPSSNSGMVMLQMTASPCQQARAPSPNQRKQPNHKHPGSDPQRTRRSVEFPPPSDNTQVQTLPDYRFHISRGEILHF